MFTFPGTWRVYLAVEPVDMRKHFDGLWAEVEQRLGEDPRQGAMFVFSNRERNRLKILYFDGTGVWVFAKRLEAGRWSWPVGSDRRKLSLTPEALTMLVSGIDLKDGCRKAWYER
jgi:transposase